MWLCRRLMVGARIGGIRRAGHCRNWVLLCGRLCFCQGRESFFGLVNCLALAAAHPALRNAQLIVHDFVRGTATGAMGDITHGVSL